MSFIVNVVGILALVVLCTVFIFISLTIRSKDEKKRSTYSLVTTILVTVFATLGPLYVLLPSLLPGAWAPQFELRHEDLDKRLSDEIGHLLIPVDNNGREVGLGCTAELESLSPEVSGIARGMPLCWNRKEEPRTNINRGASGWLYLLQALLKNEHVDKILLPGVNGPVELPIDQYTVKVRIYAENAEPATFEFPLYLDAEWEKVGTKPPLPETKPSEPSQPPPPTLPPVSPMSGATDVPQTAALSWAVLTSQWPGATEYEFKLGTGPGLEENELVIDPSRVSVPFYQPPLLLEPGKTYYWAVRATKPFPTEWSSPFVFRVSPYPPLK